MSASAIGNSMPLIEGKTKVTGSIRYTGDLVRPGMLHARLVTSQHAHARLVRVGADAARTVPGVVAVITAADLPPLPPTSRGLLLLARERVLFVGHPVALVVAETEQAASDGAERVEVEYAPLAAVLTIDQALAPDSPPVWPEGLPGSSVEAAAHGADGGGGGGGKTAVSPNVANRVEFKRGDPASGFAAADHIVELQFDTSGVHQSYIEPHAALVEVDVLAGSAVVYTNTQALHYVRDTVASVLGLENTAVRTVGTPVGGGFGGKFLLYEPLLALVAKQLGRPIRHIMTRAEEFVAANPAPATRVRVKAGARRDGTLVALEAEMVMDNGCFPNSMAMLAGVLLGSPYRTPNQVIRGVEVLTNKPSVGAYRAPCAPQCAFALEGAIDALARRLEMDPFVLRKQNACAPGDPMAVGRPWPTMGMMQVLEALERHPVWQQRAQARAAGRGVGMAIGGWPGGTEPAAAACALENDGTVQVHVGSVDLTGTNTALLQLAAETFGVEPDRVRVQTGDSASGPYSGAAGGSKILYTVGPAVIAAAREARRQTLELAASMFEADPADLEIRAGRVQVVGSPDKAIPLAKLAQRTMRYGGTQAPVFAQGRHAQLQPSPGFCAQLAEVEVDAETGQVTVHKLVVAQDVGRAINPALVAGQMMGGAIQGLGWALYEGLEWNEHGQLVTGTFADYALPRTSGLPAEAFELIQVEVPSEHGPFGARGVGEPPVIPTAAAIANAIADATGARLTRLPMTPARLRDQLLAGAG